MASASPSKSGSELRLLSCPRGAVLPVVKSTRLIIQSVCDMRREPVQTPLHDGRLQAPPRRRKRVPRFSTAGAIVTTGTDTVRALDAL